MRRPYPLGIDLGTARLRICALASDGKRPTLAAFSSRTIRHNEHVITTLREMLAELDVAERRCVTSFGEPEALLRTVALPRMSALERKRCAVYEASRFIDYDPREAALRVVSLHGSPGYYAMGIAPAAVLKVRMQMLRQAGLQPIAVDHESFAFRRALPGFDGVLDVGARASRLYLFAAPVPLGYVTPFGGRAMTAAIARSLAIDEPSAELRKKTLGTSGAGEAECRLFAREVAARVGQFRRSVHGAIRRVALVGNGARMTGLADLLSACADCRFETIDAISVPASYPRDVMRNGAGDLAHALGLALWSPLSTAS